MSFSYPPDSAADAERHLIRLRRSEIGNPAGFQTLKLKTIEFKKKLHHF